MCDNRPARAKAFIRDNAFAPAGRWLRTVFTQGDAPGWELFALAGRWLRTVFTQGDALGWELSGLIGRLCEA